MPIVKIITGCFMQKDSAVPDLVFLKEKCLSRGRTGPSGCKHDNYATDTDVGIGHITEDGRGDS